MKRIMVRTLGTLALTFSLFSMTNAATITVNLDGTGDYTSIQTALNAADDGDTVQVAAGVYVEGSENYYGNGNSVGLYIGGTNNITLNGMGVSTVIDFNHSHYGIIIYAKNYAGGPGATGITLSNFATINGVQSTLNNWSGSNRIENVVFGGTYEYTQYYSNGIENYGDLEIVNVSVDPNFVAPAAVPVPAAVWLFGSALMGLVGVRRKKV